MRHASAEPVTETVVRLGSAIELRRALVVGALAMVGCHEPPQAAKSVIVEGARVEPAPVVDAQPTAPTPVVPSPTVDTAKPVSLTRSSWGDHGRAGVHVSIEVRDGRAVLSQNTGHRIGRFARRLSAAEIAALERAVASARRADIPEPVRKPGEPVVPSGQREQLFVQDAIAMSFSPNEPLPRGVDELVEILRALTETLTEYPVAAIELDVGGKPLAARLRHVGAEPIAVRIGSLDVAATRFTKDDSPLDTKSHTVDASSIGSTVGVGWTFSLVADLGVASAPRRGFILVDVRGELEVETDADGILRASELAWTSE